MNAEPLATHVYSEFGDSLVLPCIDYKSTKGVLSYSIHCTDVAGIFGFNKRSLRFQYYYPGLYVIAEPDTKEGLKYQESDTPLITIGKCSQID